MLMFGAIAGFFLIQALTRRGNISANHIGNLFAWLIVVGLAGARFYHVLNELPYYLEHPAEILFIWLGGLGIHGALIAGLLITWWYAKKHRLGFLQLTDVLVPGLAIGQAIGRWGNYFNQELFGKPTDLAWGIPIDPTRRPAPYTQSEFFHPTFLYESLGNALISGLLVWLFRKRLQPGTITLVYFILYAVLRISTESLRIDRTPIIAGIRLPIIVSALIILASVIAWFILRTRTANAHPTKV